MATLGEGMSRNVGGGEWGRGGGMGKEMGRPHGGGKWVKTVLGSHLGWEFTTHFRLPF